jgi:hypothetical protein
MRQNIRSVGSHGNGRNFLLGGGNDICLLFGVLFYEEEAHVNIEMYNKNNALHLEDPCPT